MALLSQCHLHPCPWGWSRCRAAQPRCGYGGGLGSVVLNGLGEGGVVAAQVGGGSVGATAARLAVVAARGVGLFFTQGKKWSLQHKNGHFIAKMVTAARCGGCKG